MITRIRPAMLALIALLIYLPAVFGANSSSDATQYITYQEDNGNTVYLKDNRQPALYTGNYGDCLGGSLVNVTRFDAAYYKDNMTILFHLAGDSALVNQSVVMYIGVFAYGESRFDLLFNPCHANIRSLCPLNAGVPVVASGIIPIAPSDVAGIPPIALSIPDFEGQAILRIFSNETQTEIGCYSAIVTNGKSFSQPASVGTVLGIFTLIALIASFGTAIYGDGIPTMRLHYAHSLSVGVVFAVWQHIFFTGALSVNWPAVLVAWWSNFAWAGGMIYSSNMQNSINGLIGTNVGNTSQVGAAPADSSQDSVGGGYDISSIYKRMFSSGMSLPANHPLKRDLVSEIFDRDYGFMLRRDVVREHVHRMMRKRDDTGLVGKSDGYDWYGHPIGAGMPLPGNYSGFAGTLAEENLAASNAFMTGFLWFLIILALLVSAVVAFKWILEGLARFKRIQPDRLKFFRDHWVGYTIVVALRICFVAFFAMMFLTIFQFTFQSSGGVKAVAAIVFFIFIIGMPGAAVYACYYKKNFTDSKDPSSRPSQTERKKLLGLIPLAGKKSGGDQDDSAQHDDSEKKRSKHAFWKRKASESTIDDHDQIENIHDNEDYTMKFGWLASRFRRTRWWFFTAWIFYEFVRAIFYAGASGYALAQVFGLLIIEVVAFVYIIWARPFEGTRLNLLVVYCLGFSKVASVGLSAAFDVQFNLPRITTTVIGIVVIVIQGILAIITLVAIVVGAISSYMSISRNQEDFRPRRWHGLREKYFNHLDRAYNDLPREPKPKTPKPAKKRGKHAQQEEEVQEDEAAGFTVKGMRRMAKIEDQDADFASEMHTQDVTESGVDGTADMSGYVSDGPGQRSGTITPARRSSRPGSMINQSQTSLPYGARLHRPSWSTRDFSNAGYDGAEQSHTPVDTNRSVVDDEPVAIPSGRRSRASSMRSHKNVTLIHPMPSTDSLRIGGDVSTRDTIGNVPPPPPRSRAGTSNSWRNSMPDSPAINPAEQSEMELHPGFSHSQRNSRYNPLTPAQELEEWGTSMSPKVSREQ